ncbi:MAG: fibrobacter succinogenes major paralogous domain-containing protein [Bacteroidetes bacterium]|nr:fibrobacter succinogenes major paralogous domain-containing protein [Bacteroidota bacterium]
MKVLTLIPIFILSVLQPLEAQNDSITPKKIYHLWIRPVENMKIMEGGLFEVKDSSVMMSNSLRKKDYEHGKFDVSTVDVRSIDVVEIRKNNRPGKGIVIGGFIGLAAGVTVGMLAAGGKFTEENVFLFLAAPPLITGLGCALGALTGVAKIVIPINGNQKQFDKHKTELNNYSMKYNPDLTTAVARASSKVYDSVTDIDRNAYKTCLVDKQVWMAENLRATHYLDGTEIAGVTGDSSGSGNLYNWDAVTNRRHLCPAGWHVPSQWEWTLLFSLPGMDSDEGRKVMQNLFTDKREFQWWTSTQKSSAVTKNLYSDGKTAGIIFSRQDKTASFPVRCIRDYE